MEPSIPPTATIADACIRANVPLRIAPYGIAPVLPQWKLAGQARPVRHFGSVDVFLEAIADAKPGDVLVVDNGLRKDEGCIGDQVAMEAKLARLGGIAIWGCHRDTQDIRELDFPLFSYGALPCGPTRLDAREADTFSSARFGECLVTLDDWVVADSDGVVFIPTARKDELYALATNIWTTERAQAARALSGTTLRQQFHFSEFLRKRQTDPAYTFRQHLRQLKQSIEE